MGGGADCSQYFHGKVKGVGLRPPDLVGNILAGFLIVESPPINTVGKKNCYPSYNLRMCDTHF